MQKHGYLSAGIYAATLLARQQLLFHALRNSRPLPVSSAAGFATNSGSTEQGSQDFYEILGVERTAPAKDIKAAYYELSKKYHPDVGNSQGTSDARRFHQITEAYETLGNDDKRRQYDDEQRAISAATRIFDTKTGYSEPDLETLREFQRKWNLRRQRFHRDQAPKMKSEFDMKHDAEEFESFYRRYRENIAKARQWDEGVDSGARDQRERAARREHYSDFQKEMMRKRFSKQREQETLGYLAAIAAVLVSIVLMAGGR